MTNLIEKVKQCDSRKELRTIFKSYELLERYHALKGAIDSLNKEIEVEIANDYIGIALFKMSQVVMLEDELHVTERVILKQGVIA